MAGEIGSGKRQFHGHLDVRYPHRSTNDGAGGTDRISNPRRQVHTRPLTGTADDRWHRLKSLFVAAVNLDTAERGDWLDRNCSQDAELRKQLEELLACDTRQRGEIRGIVVRAAAMLCQSPPGNDRSENRPPYPGTRES